jgi:hypothetical protein
MRDGKNSPYNDALPRVPPEGRKGETFTMEYPWGSVGFVARTPKEMRNPPWYDLVNTDKGRKRK